MTTTQLTDAQRTQTQRSNLYLYLTVFTSGMTTLAVEMGASRLLGSVFGTSNLIWANVIGLMLLYLTVGYFVGGVLADRYPTRRALYRIILWGAFLSALIPLLARPVLVAAATAVTGIEAGLAIGSFVAVMVLFAIPITLLGTVSPFAIRLAVTNVASAGKSSGRIYAISTLGSLLGTFLPVLFIIPELGTFRTFLLFAAILYAVGMIGMWRESGTRALLYLWMPVVVIVLSIIALNGVLRPPLPGMTLLEETESAYNYLQVQQDANGYRYLSLNEGQGVHSIYHPTDYLYNGTWDFFLTAPYFNAAPYVPENVDSVALVGLAGGTIARQYSHVYGAIPIDGIEIDPEIVRLGAEYFDMNTAAQPNLNVIVQDGRYALNQLDGQYDVIGMDAYRPPYIPWHLTTVEFFAEARAKLTPDGVVVINVGRTSTDRRLVDALAATLLQVFPSVHAMDVPFSFNTILVATNQPTTADNLRANFETLPADAHPVLREALAYAQDSLVPVQPSETIFTDDRAPVETIVDSLVLNFLLGGGADELRGN